LAAAVLPLSFACQISFLFTWRTAMECQRISNVSVMLMFAASLLATLGASVAVCDETFEVNTDRYQVIGWVPYSPAGVVSIPTVARPDGTSPIPYGATLVNYEDDKHNKRFVLSLATGLDVDHVNLRLIPLDDKKKPVDGVTFSMAAARGAKQQTITFTGGISGNPAELKRFLLICDLKPKLQAQPTRGEQSDARETSAASVLNPQSTPRSP